jgi:hypothetical protein
MACRFTELVVDCVEPHLVGRFWRDVLGYEGKEEDEEFFIEGPEGSGPSILFEKVPEPKTVKNRLHIDVNPVDRTRDEEVDRVVALGATRIDIGQGDASWVVLADPEGNEFCVLNSRVDPV